MFYFYYNNIGTELRELRKDRKFVTYETRLSAYKKEGILEGFVQIKSTLWILSKNVAQNRDKI